jgi:uncharacterized membrane protein (DUF485 family)
MNLFNNIIFKISIFSIGYLVILMIISPMIDHSFTSLDEDINMKETNFQILGEVILHLLFITIVWYFIYIYIQKYAKKMINLKIDESVDIAIGIVSSIALIGLQKNLVDKLEYITITHPFRYTELYR